MNTQIFLVHTLNSSTQCIFLLLRSFMDSTFCGIFFCGPLKFKCQIFLPILLPHNVTLHTNTFYGGNVACISVSLFFFFFFSFLLPFTFTSVAARISHFLTAAIKKTPLCCCYFLSNNPIGHAIYRQNACALEMQNFTRMKGGTTDVRMHYSVRTKMYWMYR